MPAVVGVDTGGTFTDTVVLSDDGRIAVGKRPSSAPEFVQGVCDSAEHAAEGLDMSLRDLLDETEMFLHGTTIVVNAAITGNVARIGLLTTKGFRDTIFIARAMSRLAGLTPDRIRRAAENKRPKPLIPPSKRLVKEVVERIDWKGEVLVQLDEDGVRRAVAELVADGAEAIAVCFLWSFRNPSHELRVAELIEEVAPGMTVSLSSQLVPKMGEYERTATAGFNAALSKVATGYLDRLSVRLRDEGLDGRLLIMQGNGGLLPVEEAAETPANLMGSGPAGGILGAKILGDRMGIHNIICTDVGGTSFDVGLIVDGEPLITPKAVVNQHTLFLPLLDVISIGAGGGSIAEAMTDGGARRLSVGPASAGARPGPVCYGLGGTSPTVTDADLVLGMVNPDFFLGGAMRLDVEAAREAIRAQIAEPLEMSVEEAAAGIVRVVDEHMADLMRQVTVERGHDPRDFTAFLFGGGGPLHGTSYAAKLGLRSMIVPGGPLASVFSAWGIASADIHHTLEQTEFMAPPFDAAAITEVLNGLDDRARTRLADNGVAPNQQILQRFVEMRYTMQTHELAVVVPPGPVTDATVDVLVAAFEDQYERRYGKGTAFSEAGYEIFSFRVQAWGKLPKPEPAPKPRSTSALQPAATRAVFWPELYEHVETSVYRVDAPPAGTEIDGPAIFELSTTTVALRPGQRLSVDDMGNFLIAEQRGES